MARNIQLPNYPKRGMVITTSTDNLRADILKQKHEQEVVKMRTTVGKSLEINRRFLEFNEINLVLNGVFDLKLSLTIVKKKNEKYFYKSTDCLDTFNSNPLESVSIKSDEPPHRLVDDVISKSTNNSSFKYMHYLVDASLDDYIDNTAKSYNTKISMYPLQAVEEAFRSNNWEQMFLVLALLKHRESHLTYITALRDAFFYSCISNMYHLLPVFRNIPDFFIEDPYYIKEEILRNHLWDYLNPLLAKLIPSTVSFLHICAITNHSEMLEGLLELDIGWIDEIIGKEDSNEERCEKLSPLHLACLANSPRCVKILLKNKVNTNSLSNSYWAKTPLICAIVSGGKLELVDMLINHGAYIDYNSSPCGTALHLAVSLGLQNYVKHLIELGADINVLAKVDIPLVVRIVQQLSVDKKVQCDVENFERRNCTPLMLACLLGEEEIMKDLLVNMADPNISDCLNQTAIFYAISQWRNYMLDILAKYKANFNHACDDNRNTTLLDLLLNTNKALDKENFLPCIRTLIMNKVDLGYTNSRGESAIQLLFGTNYNQNTEKNGTDLIFVSVRDNCYNFIKILIKNDVALNVEDDDFNTPLHIVCQQGYSELIQLLLEQGADPYAMNSIDVTPLQLVVERGDYNSVEQMLNCNTEYSLSNLASRKRISPWMTAAEAGNDRILSMLIRKLKWEDKLPWRLMFRNQMTMSIQTWLIHPDYFVSADPKRNSCMYYNSTRYNNYY